MFDIGFSELLVCGIVALIVIGPERMPDTVRTIGLWIGRFKRSLRETRQEIERQIGVEDIRRQLHNEDIMRSLEKTRDDINHELNSVIEQVKSELDEEEQSRARVQEQQLPDHSQDPQRAPVASEPLAAQQDTATAEPITTQAPIKNPQAPL